jgi:hypothetical protein
MFGTMEGLHSFIRRQIGLRTDTSNIDGSVHSKIRELRDYVDSRCSTLDTEIATVQKPRGEVDIGTAETNDSTNWTTVLNITGRGKLIHFYGRYDSNSTNRSVSCRITVDGIRVGGGSIYLC